MHISTSDIGHMLKSASQIIKKIRIPSVNILTILNARFSMENVLRSPASFPQIWPMRLISDFLIKVMAKVIAMLSINTTKKRIYQLIYLSNNKTKIMLLTFDSKWL